MRRRNRLLLLLVLTAVLMAALGCAKGSSDTAIATDIKSGMFSDPDLRSSNLDVSVKDGEVTLSGVVPNAEAQLRAFKLASAAPGVTKVNDQMQLAEVQAAQSQPATPAPPQTPMVPAPHQIPIVRVPHVKRTALTTAPPVPIPAAQPAPESPKAPPVNETPPAAAPPPPFPPEPQPVDYEIPSGTRVSIRMVDSIDSEENHAGDVFRATTDLPISIKGQEVIPKNTDIFVKLANAKSAGRVTGSSELELQLYRMEYQGKTYSLVSNSYQTKASSRTNETATRVGIGSVAGTVIGAIAGGGKGAAIGAAVGGGTATGVQLATRGKQINVPSETPLDFTLQAPVTVTIIPKKSSPK